MCMSLCVLSMVTDVYVYTYTSVYIYIYIYLHTKEKKYLSDLPYF